MELAKKFLGPPLKGIEIGASQNNPFPGIDAWNLDRFFSGVFKEAQIAIAGESALIDIIGTAQLLPVTDECVDFVLASHVLEHMPDTIRTLREWDRVVKPGGIVFMIVPHKERTFDRTRPVTALEHHLADYALETTITRDALVPTSHYHVWTTEEVLRLIEHLNENRYLNWRIEAVEDVDSKVGNGFTIVARKRNRTDEPLPQAPSRIAFHQLTLKFPFQVVGRSLETIVPGPALLATPSLVRGLYRCVPIYAGFPPICGPGIDLEIGSPVPPPEIERTWLSAGKLFLTGSHLNQTTWLEAVYPDGAVHCVLPEFEDGNLILSLEGMHLPDAEIPVTPVNSPPGGGPGPEFLVKTRDI